MGVVIPTMKPIWNVVRTVLSTVVAWQNLERKPWCRERERHMSKSGCTSFSLLEHHFVILVHKLQIPNWLPTKIPENTQTMVQQWKKLNVCPFQRTHSTAKRVSVMLPTGSYPYSRFKFVRNPQQVGTRKHGRCLGLTSTGQERVCNCKKHSWLATSSYSYYYY